MLRVESPETTVMSIQNEMHCNADARYAHRLHAVLMVAQGMSCVQVVSVLGDSASAIQKWVKDYNRKGLSALHDAAIPGRPSRLSPEHMKKIESILRRSPKAAGLDCVIWDGVDAHEKWPGNEHWEWPESGQLGEVCAMVWPMAGIRPFFA